MWIQRVTSTKNAQKCTFVFESTCLTNDSPEVSRERSDVQQPRKHPSMCVTDVSQEVSK